MNCREFRDRWDDLLDARSSPAVEAERALESHASACPRCALLSSGYQSLRQATRTLRPPVPSADSIGRLYRLTVPSSPSIPIGPSRPRPRRLASMAAAAAFALAWIGGGWWPSPGPAGRPSPGPPLASVARALPDRALGLALAEATVATLDLAREASAPASRIGREMLELGRYSREGLDRLSGSHIEAATPAELDAPGLIQAVGERVGAGVRPLSGSARYAFGFLFGPPDPTVPAVPSKRNRL